MVIMVLSPTPTAKYLIVTNYKLWGISIAFPNSLLSFSLHPKAHAYLLIKQLQDKKKKAEWRGIGGLSPSDYLLLRRDTPRFHIQWQNNQRCLGTLNMRSGTSSCLLPQIQLTIFFSSLAFRLWFFFQRHYYRNI